MLRLLGDENFNGDIVRGLQRRTENVEIRIALDAGLTGLSDPALLDWAAVHGYIVLTHDRNTMTDFAHERVRAGLAMPGVILVSDHISIGDAIDELLLVVECSEPQEWNEQVLFIPMR